MERDTNTSDLFSDAAFQLFDFLQTLPIKPGTRAILCNNPPRFPCTARGKTLAAIYTAFAKRLDARMSASAPADRLQNTLPCLQASPGGGKSFLLDELAALKKTDLELCESTEMKEILLHSVAISITFNSDSMVVPAVEKDMDPVVTRVLWAYFFDPKHQNVSFHTFCEKLVNKFAERAYTFMLETALACIRLHLASSVGSSSSALPSTPILLCVDELLKVSTAPQPSAKDPQVAKALSTIGKQLNEDPYFNVVVSTLDSGPMLVERTRSGRPITWIPLPPLTLKDSLLLFKSILDEEKEPRAKANIALATRTSRFNSGNSTISIQRWTSAVYAADGTELSLQDMASYVLMPAAGNPGSDITLIEKKPDNRGYIVINIECRYSHPTSGTQLTTSELERKWELMQQQFKPLFVRSHRPKPKELKNMQLKPEDVYLVVCAFRQSAVVVPDSLPQLLVLGREKLQELYSPSLAIRPQFLSGPEWESLMSAVAPTERGQDEKYSEAELKPKRLWELQKILKANGFRTSRRKKDECIHFIIQNCNKRKQPLSPVESEEEREEEEKEEEKEKAKKAKDIKGKGKVSHHKKQKKSK